ncbi:hypothetical protein EDB80DRAFT_593491 [Ilyonectria destructans]|nr:hypothetical protein EDB80DRAFT_593491 [Ilyonectria destructans]
MNQAGLTDPQKKLSCQHHYHLVDSWCPKYIETERRCQPTIASNIGKMTCTSACRERQQPSNSPWAKLIQRPKSRMAYTPHMSAQ